MTLTDEDFDPLFNLANIGISFIPVGKMPIYNPKKMKAPFDSVWQDNPYRLEDCILMILRNECTGLGIINGKHSNGLLSLDVDGYEAYEFFEQNFGRFTEYYSNLVWTSGKECRMQLGWHVPAEHWQSLKTVKVGPAGSLEFRFTGSQSVIAPSRHPQTGRYRWLIPPMGEPLEPIPSAVLAWWLERCRSIPDKVSVQEDSGKTFQSIVLDDDVKIQRVRGLISIYKKHHPRISYDEWILRSWEIADELGAATAESIMSEFYPPYKNGDYRPVFKSFKEGGGRSVRSLIWEARICDPIKTDEVLNAAIAAQRETRLFKNIDENSQLIDRFNRFRQKKAGAVPKPQPELEQ